MSKENFVIGVLGGMGTYATINLFKQYQQCWYFSIYIGGLYIFKL